MIGKKQQHCFWIQFLFYSIVIFLLACYWNCRIVCVCVHVHMLQFLFALEQSGVSLKGDN